MNIDYSILFRCLENIFRALIEIFGLQELVTTHSEQG